MIGRWISFFVLVSGVALHAQTKHTSLPVVKPIHVRDLKELVKRDSGKIVFVNAWATWCKPCKEEMPQLVRLRKKYAQQLSLILVSADDSEIVDTKVRPTLKSLGVDFPSFIINERTDEAFINGMDSTWNGALPTTFIYDRSGKLDTMTTGGRTYQQFEALLNKCLKQ